MCPVNISFKAVVRLSHAGPQTPHSTSCRSTLSVCWAVLCKASWNSVVYYSVCQQRVCVWECDLEGWPVGEVTEMTSVRVSMFPSTFSQPAGTLVSADDRVVTSVDSSALCVAGFVLEPRPSLSNPGLLPCLAPGRYSLDAKQRRSSHCDNEQDFPSF